VLLLSLPPPRGPPERQEVRPTQARLAWHALSISAPEVQCLSDIKYPSLESLSLSFFGHMIIFHESPFLFDLILRTLLCSACVWERVRKWTLFRALVWWLETETEYYEN